MNRIQNVLIEMIDYDAGDARRIHHFIKVHQFAKLIGELEGLDTRAQEIVEIAALVHDIGIHRSEEKYHSSAGAYQELEGPPEAESLLRRVGCPEELIGRVCWLVGHHHRYNSISELDHQILVEADFLVNAYEDEMDVSAIEQVRDKIFKTFSGRRLLQTLYLPDATQNRQDESNLYYGAGPRSSAGNPELH